MESLKNYLLESVKHPETLGDYPYKINRKKASWFFHTQYPTSTKFDWLNGKSINDILDTVKKSLAKTDLNNFTEKSFVEKHIQNDNWDEKFVIKRYNKWLDKKYKNLEDVFDKYASELECGLQMLAYKKNDVKKEEPLDVAISIQMHSQYGEINEDIVTAIFKQTFGIDVATEIFYRNAEKRGESLYGDLNSINKGQVEHRHAKVLIYMSVEDLQKIS